jgi:hypothetical protein
MFRKYLESLSDTELCVITDQLINNSVNLNQVLNQLSSKNSTRIVYKGTDEELRMALFSSTSKELSERLLSRDRELGRLKMA